MNINKYLERINYKGDLSPTLEVLRQLQKHHLLNIPFENLEIHYGDEITLDLDKLYHKVVEKNKGGYCYELNGLFYELLKELGFNVEMISAQVYDGDGGYGKEFDHLALLVEIDSNFWLTDVGFGKFSVYPIQLLLNEEMNNGNEKLIITEEKDMGKLKISKYNQEKEEYVPLHLFTTQKRQLSDFEEMCKFQQTPPNHFTRKKVCTQLINDGNGRITLTDKKLIITRDGKKEETEIKSEDQFIKSVQYYFGIVINN